MPEKLHLLSESLRSFSVADSRGNTASITLGRDLAFNDVKESSLSCTNGVSILDNGQFVKGGVEGAMKPSEDPFADLSEKMGPAEKLIAGAKLLITGHAAVDLGELPSPLQTVCNAVKKATEPSR